MWASLINQTAKSSHFIQLGYSSIKSVWQWSHSAWPSHYTPLPSSLIIVSLVILPSLMYLVPVFLGFIVSSSSVFERCSHSSCFDFQSCLGCYCFFWFLEPCWPRTWFEMSLNSQWRPGDLLMKRDDITTTVQTSESPASLYIMFVCKNVSAKINHNWKCSNVFYFGPNGLNCSCDSILNVLHLLTAALKMCTSLTKQWPLESTTVLLWLLWDQ